MPGRVLINHGCCIFTLSYFYVRSVRMTISYVPTITKYWLYVYIFLTGPKKIIGLTSSFNNLHSNNPMDEIRMDHDDLCLIKDEEPDVDAIKSFDFVNF